MRASPKCSPGEVTTAQHVKRPRWSAANRPACSEVSLLEALPIAPRASISSGHHEPPGPGLLREAGYTRVRLLEDWDSHGHDKSFFRKSLAGS